MALAWVPLAAVLGAGGVPVGFGVPAALVPTPSALGPGRSDLRSLLTSALFSHLGYDTWVLQRWGRSVSHIPEARDMGATGPQSPSHQGALSRDVPAGEGQVSPGVMVVPGPLAMPQRTARALSPRLGSPSVKVNVRRGCCGNNFQGSIYFSQF